MPIQSSAILKNIGPKQDVKYWMWTGVGSSTRLVHHPNLEDSFMLTDSTISRVASGGNIVWTRASYAGNTRDIAVDSSGDLYTLTQSGTVIKYSISGQVIWAISLIGSGVSPDAYKIAVGASNSVYIASRHNNEGTLIKLNSNGTFAWARKVLTLSFGENVAVDEANSRVYFGGASGGGYVAAFDLNGSIQWQKDLALSGFGWINSLNPYSGQVFVTWFGSYGSGLSMIFRYNTSGSLLGAYSSSGNPSAVRTTTNPQTGQTAVAHSDGTVAKYSNSWSLISSAKLPDPPYAASYPDIDSDGDMHFHASTTVAKVKGDFSGAGTYGSVSIGSATASPFSGDNSRASYSTSSSLSVTSITLSSTAIVSPSPTFTSAPAGNFISIRTK